MSHLHCISEDCLVYTLKQSKTIFFPIMSLKLDMHLSPYEPKAHYIKVRKSQKASHSDPLFIRFWPRGNLIRVPFPLETGSNLARDLPYLILQLLFLQ